MKPGVTQADVEKTNIQTQLNKPKESSIMDSIIPKASAMEPPTDEELKTLIDE
jgi:hypothetical protein